MRFRSHVARPFDLGLWSNRILFALIGASAVAALVFWAEGEPLSVFWAPAHVFVFWAIAREVDPDRDLTAHLAGAGAGIWALIGQPTPEILAVGALVLATRVLLNSTGRRPLVSDLVVIGLFASAIAYTRVGWVGAVALAIAVYVDGRLAEGANTASVVTAGAASVGATIVATAANAFDVKVVEVDPVLVTVAGVAAIMMILRAPPEPWSLVDSKLKWRLDQGRLHGSRALLAVTTFAITILHGDEAERATPLIALLVLGLVSSEIERLRRRV
ncbi:MAG TPA: hypothetical protein VF246_06055 [Acidimicrobiia bacterium]